MKPALSRRSAAEETPQTHPERSSKPFLRALAVVALGGVIAGVPAMTVPDPGLSKFGWQMFAMSVPVPEFTVWHRNGSTSEVSAAEFAAKLRGDVEYVMPGVEWICSHDATAVRVGAKVGDDDAGEFVCAAS